MITLSKQALKREAIERGYRPEILEKVYRLLDLLESLMEIDYLRERLVLKGGTAINLFCSEQLPRLSVDLDFNYIGAIDRETMRKEKLILESMILDVCQRLHYQLHRNPRAHAGGKMVLIYPSVDGNKGRLEIDFNYVFRVPLWMPEQRFSLEWPKRTQTTVLDIHELAAGKLHALLGREASRDLFDSYQLFTQWNLNREKLRQAFTVYAGMEREHWKSITVDKVTFIIKEIRDQLIPVLHKDQISSFSTQDIKTWATHLAEKTRKALLDTVLPFNENEVAFLDCLEHYKEIRPEFISTDPEFCQRIADHPLLKWRIQRNKNRE